MPLLLPLWQEKDYSEVWLLPSQTTSSIANNLAKFIKRDPTLSHLLVRELQIIDAYNLVKARSTISEIINRVAGKQKILINLTAGTKIMSLAAMQASRGTDTTLLYVSTEEHSLTFFQADSDINETKPIQVKITVEQYLSAHGLETSNSQNFGYKYSDIVPTKEGDELETKVFTLCRDSGLFDDVRRNLFIRKTSGDKAVANELDVVVTRNGKLAVCSCKSGKIGNQALYELASLSRREVAGIYCGKALASSKSDLPPGVVHRAKEDHIRLICADELENTAEIIFQITQ
jgi:hypothetical protein